MRLVMGISVCLMAAVCGAAIGAPPPAERVIPATPLVAPAAPRSLWCENVVEMQTARRSGVTSIWLSNGVRVHHLRLGTRPGQVVATIALSGGKLLEDASSRGITEIAAGVLGDSVASAPNASAAEHIADRNVRIDAGAGLDALTLQLTGSVADASAAMRVMRELLVSPTVTRESVDASREQLVRELRLRGADARSAVSDATNAAVGGGADARMMPPEERTLGAMTVERVTEWIQRHAKENGAAMEVAIVGDLALADALAMVDITLGTLPKREQVSATTNATRRVLAGGPVGAVQREVLGISQVGTGRATVVRGCFGPEMAELADQRVLRALVRVAIARVKTRLAEPELGLGAGGAAAVEVSGGVYVSPFVGHGMVLLSVTADAGKVAAVGAVIDAELAKLAAAPPSADELAPIADELGKVVTKLEQDPTYWSAVLARCDALGMDPDEVASGAAYYKALAPERVSEVFRKFWRDERRISITVRGPERAVSAPVGKR